MAQSFTRNESCEKYERFRFCSLARTTENAAFRATTAIHHKTAPLLGAVLWWAEVDSNQKTPFKTPLFIRVVAFVPQMFPKITSKWML